MESLSPPAPCGHAAPGPELLEGRDRMLGLAGRFAVVRCRECGLAYTLPAMTAGELARHYPDDYLPHRSGSGSANLRERVGAAWDRLRFRLRNRYGGLRPVAAMTPGRLLDVGCGVGDLAAWFSERGWSVAGVEPSGPAAWEAAARGIDVHRGTLADAPFGRCSFDAAIFNHSLEHVSDPGADLSRVRELLRPGGVLAVSVPNFAGWQRRAFGTHWFHLDLPRHRQHFEPETLAAVLHEAGFADVRTRTATSMVGLPASLLYRRHGEKRVPAGWLQYASYPLAASIGAVRGGDVLHAEARRP